MVTAMNQTNVESLHQSVACFDFATAKRAFLQLREEHTHVEGVP